MNFACRLPSGQQTFSLILILFAYQFLEDGQWSMPVHHKASTMWAQAVGKKKKYIALRVFEQTCFKSGRRGGNFQGPHRNVGAILRPPAITPNDPKNSRQSRRSDEHLTAKLWRLRIWICHGQLITLANIVGA